MKPTLSFGARAMPCTPAVLGIFPTMAGIDVEHLDLSSVGDERPPGPLVHAEIIEASVPGNGKFFLMMCLPPPPLRRRRLPPTQDVVKGTLELVAPPEFAAADGQGHVFVNLEDKSETPRIDSNNLTIEQCWPLAPCSSPSSRAIDRQNKRLFIGRGNKMMAVLNAETGQVVATLPIGDHVDATAFDPATGLIFNANGEGAITVIHEDYPDKYSPVETVQTQPGAKTLALDPKTHKLFLSVAGRSGSRGPIQPGSFAILVVGQ